MNFDENIERSLEKIGYHIERTRKEPEARELTDRELVKHSLKSLAQTQKEEDASPSAPAVKNVTILPTYLQREDVAEEAKAEVEGLVNLFFSRGLEPALKEASKHSPFVEDAFHDALVDKLLPELKKKGFLK